MEMLDKLPEDAQNYIKSQMNFNLNVDFDDRSLIGDDPNDFSDVNYGNADVEGPDALHGTHVSGIIGAIRGNGLGGEALQKMLRLWI